MTVPETTFGVPLAVVERYSMCQARVRVGWPGSGWKEVGEDAMMSPGRALSAWADEACGAEGADRAAGASGVEGAGRAVAVALGRPSERARAVAAVRAVPRSARVARVERVARGCTMRLSQRSGGRFRTVQLG